MMTGFSTTFVVSITLGMLAFYLRYVEGFSRLNEFRLLHPCVHLGLRVGDAIRAGGSCAKAPSERECAGNQERATPAHSGPTLD